MTCKLIQKLKQRGYKQNQIVDHIQHIKFTGRKEALKRKNKPKQTGIHNTIHRRYPQNQTDLQ